VLHARVIIDAGVVLAHAHGGYDFFHGQFQFLPAIKVLEGDLSTMSASYVREENQPTINSKRTPLQTRAVVSGLC
jgi:hypothetical protein